LWTKVMLGQHLAYWTCSSRSEFRSVSEGEHPFLIISVPLIILLSVPI
jgi:hypothetical protein